MNDQAMQKDRPSRRTSVRELPVIWLGHRHRADLPWGSGVFSHPVKVGVRLVSFFCPAFEMNWPETAVCSITLRCGFFSQRTPDGLAGGYVSCRNVFSSSVNSSMSATVRCNDCIAAATCLRKCLWPLIKPRNP